MTALRRARSWLRARPVAADALLALLLVVPSGTGRVNALPGAPVAPTTVSQALVVLSCLAIVFRRRRPVVVWALTLLAAVAVVMLQHGPSSAVLPLLVALFTVASRHPVRWTFAATTLSAGLLLGAQAISTSDSWAKATTYAVATWCVLAAVVGIAVRLQRRALAEARQRARAAEESREEEAQRRVTEERLRIARELHDVVAHHIAVITVQSGVAEHLRTSNPAAAGEALSHVRQAGAQVLAEMSALLGVLRDGDDITREPLRGLARLDELVASLRRTGLQVVVRREGTPVRLAPLVDVTAYRIVEEALTNAHKHGTGSAQLLIAHRDAGTVIEVRNPVGTRPQPPAGTGQGLTGMRERVAAVGGLLRVGPDRNGWFAVRAELPTDRPLTDRPLTDRPVAGGTAVDRPARVVA